MYADKAIYDENDSAKEKARKCSLEIKRERNDPNGVGKVSVQQ